MAVTDLEKIVLQASLICEKHNDSWMVAACCAKSSLILGLGALTRPYHDVLVDETKNL